MPEQSYDKPQVRISADQMEAYLWLPVPADGEVYTIRQLREILAEKGVTAGIEEDKLYHILEDKIYAREVRAAVGVLPTDGIDGYFDFQFNRELNSKPKLLPDGSVDYWSMNLIEMVHAGQTIAKYVPPVQGKPGYTVKGIPKLGKRGKDLPPLKGKGFQRSEDNLIYTSTIDGKIEMTQDRITILPTYEIFGDADLTSVGNINFVGDVVIHGVVHSGLCVKASGNITIDGIVEAVELEAGKDIVLRSGMMGGQRARVKAKKDIFAKFFEYTTIEAGGNLQADVLMECHAECGESVVLNGSHGSVIGGSIRAIQGLEATNLGNAAEISTDICVGVNDDKLRRANLLSRKIEATRENISTIEEDLIKFEELAKERGISYKEDPRRLQLLRSKIKDSATLAQDEAELGDLQEIISRARDATVKAFGTVYPGVMIQLNDTHVIIKMEQHNVEYVLNRGQINAMSMADL